MPTILAICQNVANDIGTESPASLFSTTNDTSKRFLAQARRAIREMVRRHDWTILQLEHTFNTTASDADYVLPSDFDRFIDETLWSRTDYWELRGPLTPQQWQRYKSGIVNTGPRQRWRVKANGAALNFHVDPTPSDVRAMVFEYISKNAILDTDGSTTKADWAADTDSPLIDDHVLELSIAWRMRRRLGMDYASEYAEYENAQDVAIGNDGGAGVLRLGGHTDPVLGANIQESGFGGG